MKYNESNKWNWFAACIVTFFLMIFIFVLLPYASFIYEKYTLMQDQQERIKLASTSEASLEILSEQKEKIEKIIGKVYVNLPGQGEFSKVADQILQNAKKNTVIVEKMIPGEQVIKDKYVAHPIELELTGSYHQTAKFINALEQGDFMIKIQSVKLEKADDPDTVNASLIVEATFLKEGVNP